jgi:hypothetical protein
VKKYSNGGESWKMAAAKAAWRNNNGNNDNNISVMALA